MKNFPLGFVEVRSTRLSFGFCSAILNLVTWPASPVPRLLVHKNVTGVVQMDHVRLCSSKTAEENEENIVKLDVLMNRQNIKLFASTPVTDFHAGRARFDISAEFFQKISFRQE